MKVYYNLLAIECFFLPPLGFFNPQEFFLCKQDCICCNLSLGLMTKARAYKGAGQEGSPGVTSYAPGNVGDCEGMNPHTPK
jgi:hypothetical protein